MSKAEREIIDRLEALHEDVRALSANLTLVREAVLGLGQRVGRLEQEPLTPIPHSPRDSWATPDMGRR